MSDRNELETNDWKHTQINIIINHINNTEPMLTDQCTYSHAILLNRAKNHWPKTLRKIYNYTFRSKIFKQKLNYHWKNHSIHQHVLCVFVCVLWTPDNTFRIVHTTVIPCPIFDFLLASHEQRQSGHTIAAACVIWLFGAGIDLNQMDAKKKTNNNENPFDDLKWFKQTGPDGNKNQTLRSPWIGFNSVFCIYGH